MLGNMQSRTQSSLRGGFRVYEGKGWWVWIFFFSPPLQRTAHLCKYLSGETLA